MSTESKDPAKAPLLSPVRIVAIYAFFGIVWIILSDNLAARLAADHSTLVRVTILKGVLFILATAGLIWGLLRHFVRQIVLTQDECANARVQAEQEITHLTYYDRETRLPNYNLFIDRLSQLIALDSRERHTTAVIYITLTNFKAIVDAVGISGSKEVLKNLAHRLSETMRQVDTVARINRDEFVIALGGTVQETDISIILSKLEKLFKYPVALPHGEMLITAAMGVACFPTDGIDAEILLDKAHIAMNQARSSAGSGFQFFSESMNVKALDRIRIESSMLEALEAGEFYLCYQPKFAINGKDIVGMEALVRWNRDGKTIAPGVFIPIAEENGSIVMLGEWVLRTACRQNKKWQDEGLPPKRVSINISAHQLRDNGFVDLVASVLRETGLPSEYLELELTESVIMDDPQDTVLKLMLLKKLGVTISIDDFGTGYSSLSYLKHLPIDVLKIDRSFIMDIGRDPDDEAIVSAIVLLAQSLELRVVAEGVETQQQLDFLSGKQCDEIQGYLLSRPLDVGQFEAFLRHGSMLTETNGGDGKAAPISQSVPIEPSEATRVEDEGTVSVQGNQPTPDYVGELVLMVEPILPSANINQILNRFLSDKDLLIVPVVENGVAIGMVNRLTFFEDNVIGRNGFGIHINHKKKIKDLMGPVEITIDAKTRIDEAAVNIQALKSGARIENACITSNGSYIGLLDVNRFISTVTERNLTLARGANPLTGLPGNDSIQREIIGKLAAGKHFDIAYIDIDNFKPYNDHYGFQKGDVVIKALSEIVVAEASGLHCFCGHIGGDDFILISNPNTLQALSERVIHNFDAQLRRFHSERDFADKCFRAVNRRGETETFSLLSLSIGVVNTLLTPVASYAQLASIATDVKKEAKKRAGSVVINCRFNSIGDR